MTDASVRPHWICARFGGEQGKRHWKKNRESNPGMRIKEDIEREKRKRSMYAREETLKQEIYNACVKEDL